MQFSLRREYTQLVTSGAQLLLLFAGFKLQSRTGWLVCLSIMALVSIPAWLSALHRLRAIRDTPTSKVASAAQGYVELIGRGERFSDTPLLGKFTLLPCLWYRYTVEQLGSRNKWRTVDSGESSDSFLLRDDTGVCVVDLEQAEIITRHSEQWRDGDLRYTEWKLLEQETIYVIGQFRTQGGSNLEFDSKAELNDVLTEWKKDMPALHARFDLDNNGELDMQEWMLARKAAQREVAKRLFEAQSQPDTNIICQPRDGKLFLISDLTPERLSQRYLLWSWAHLLIFFAALGGLSWLLGMGHFA